MLKQQYSCPRKFGKLVVLIDELTRRNIIAIYGCKGFLGPGKCGCKAAIRSEEAISCELSFANDGNTLL